MVTVWYKGIASGTERNVDNPEGWFTLAERIPVKLLRLVTSTSKLPSSRARSVSDLVDAFSWKSGFGARRFGTKTKPAITEAAAINTISRTHNGIGFFIISITRPSGTLHHYSMCRKHY